MVPLGKMALKPGGFHYTLKQGEHPERHQQDFAYQDTPLIRLTVIIKI